VFLGLFNYRTLLWPTWRGWLVLLLVMGGSVFAAVRGVYGFLAVQDSQPGGALAVEGWAPDHALVAALAEFHRHPYLGLFVTGVPLEKGDVLAEHQTYAELSAAILLRHGADPATVHAVPTPAVRQDRTYATAVALRTWLRTHGLSTEKVNVVSLGAHARRTRLLYQKAFGPAAQIGIIAVEDQGFEREHWWRSSQGFRTVTGEVIAYLYVCLLFHPPAPSPE
jgi:hypothetical protein